MAISEQRYAAEMADLDGNVMKFDNIDCMIRYAAAHGMKDKAGAWFVMDSDGREWLDARQAFLVKSASIPGSYGKRGFGDQRFRGGQGTRSPVLGEVLRLEDLWKQ
jgi:nitrous oxide reductase accessory protein NosL